MSGVRSGRGRRKVVLGKGKEKEWCLERGRKRKKRKVVRHR